MSKQMAFGPSGGLVEYKFRVDTSEAFEKISELNQLWTTYLSLVRRAGLPEDLTELMSRIQQMRVTAQTAIKTIELYQLALAGAGPVGWLLFAGSAAITGLMLADQMSIRSPRY